MVWFREYIGPISVRISYIHIGYDESDRFYCDVPVGGREKVRLAARNRDRVCPACRAVAEGNGLVIHVKDGIWTASVRGSE